MGAVTQYGTREPEANDASLGELAKGAARDASTLVRKELELAKLELRGQVRTATPGVAMLVGAGVVGLAVLGALTAAMILAVDLVLPGWAAALVVTGFWAVVAGALALAGRSRLRAAAAGPVPAKTVDSLREDVDVAKEAARSHPEEARGATRTEGSGGR